MIGKKAGIGGDIFVFVVFVVFLIFISLGAIFVIMPNAVKISKYQIEEQTEDMSNNPFMYGFLRQKIEDKNMADLIALSYMGKNYGALKEKTTEILEKTNREINYEIYVNNKRVAKKGNLKGKPRKYIVTLPLPNKEIIEFKLMLYEKK